MHSTQNGAGFPGSNHKARRGFIKRTAIATLVLALSGVTPLGMFAAQAATGKAEQPSLKFGFIKLTDRKSVV